MMLPLLTTVDEVLFPGMPFRVRDAEVRCEMYPDMLGAVALGRGGFIGNATSPAIFATGCSARVLPPNENPCQAGVVLQGLQEITIRKITRSGGAASALVTPCEVGGALGLQLAFRLRRSLRRLAPNHDCLGFLLNNPAVPDRFLLNAGCYVPSWLAGEKQWFLAASTLNERAERLCTCIDIVSAPARLSSPAIPQRLR